jgi:tetratricopeptide (TPR) repeat protein
MPLPLLSDVLVETIADRGLAAAVVQYADIMDNNRDDYAGGSLELEVRAHGRAALALHEHDLAIEISQLNVELYPNSWRVYRDLADAYRAAGDATEGERLAAVADDMRDRESTIMQHLRSRAYDEARRIIQRAHETNPDAQLLTPARIGPYFDETLMAGDSENALELCRIWALANPGTAGPYFSMARVYRSQGDIEQLRATYERILEIQPEGRSADAARRALEELRR